MTRGDRGFEVQGLDSQQTEEKDAAQTNLLPDL